MIPNDNIPAECRAMSGLLDPLDRQAVRRAWNIGLISKRERRPGELMTAEDVARAASTKNYQEKNGKS